MILLYVVGLLPKDMCYVWDTDDLTIERVRMRDVGYAILAGIKFENLPDVHLYKDDLDEDMRFYLSLSSKYKRKVYNKGLIEVYVQPPPLIYDKKFVCENAVCMITTKNRGTIVVWYNEILYVLPTHYEVLGKNGLMGGTAFPYAMGVYQNSFRLIRKSLKIGMKAGLTMKDGKIYTTDKKYELKDYTSCTMSRSTFNRKMLMGEFD